MLIIEVNKSTLKSAHYLLFVTSTEPLKTQKIFILGNNALHSAVKEGYLDVTRILLTESSINAEACNNKVND